MSALRILYVINAFETDAPTMVSLQIARAAQLDGMGVKVIAWSRGGPSQTQLQSAGIESEVLGRGVVRGALALAKVIRKFSPQIVHTVLARPTLGMAVARLLTPVRSYRWIASDHGVHEWHEKGRLRAATMERIMPGLLSLADAVITPSEHAAQQLIGRGLNSKTLHVIPNGVDLQRFVPGSRQGREAFLHDQFPADNPAEVWPLIGSAGNLRALKGYSDLVDAMPAVLQSFPNARLVIWGSGPELELLKSRTEQHSINHAVRLCGYENAIENLLPLLDLYVQPSRTESFGLAAAEAMACGVPIITSDAGGLPALQYHGEVGRLFPVGNVTELAKVMARLLADNAAMSDISTAARLRVEKHYSLPAMLEKTMALYKQLAPACQQRSS